MAKCVLFIDGENFLHKVEEIINLNSKVKKEVHPEEIDFDKLFESPLRGINPNRKIFYAARLHQHPETIQKSQELIKLQRKLRNNLVKNGYEFIIAGNVRAQIVKAGKDSKVVFREKGVDVKIAVDLVSMACDKNLDVAILCSSDSDLQPAVAELKKRKIEIIYLGFENQPNKGLTFTTNRTILIRNSEVLEAFNYNK
jgi:uncharacterized LabA/DUF88 family protein